MNVVIWARVSSREQKEGYSLDAQIRANRDRALKNGWTVIREFVVAESAKRGVERTVFNEMFKWVKTNAKREKIKAILAHKLDRVCRNMKDAVRLQELEDDCSVQLAFVENQFGPGAAGALSFNVMAAVSQYYSDNLRTEVLKGMDERVRQGWPSGLAPFGYLNVGDRDEPVQPHPVESKTLIRMFQLYATGKHTFETLSEKLAAEGFQYVPSQPRFNRTGLSHILRNRFYVGELHRNGNVYQGKYRLIIDRPTFHACQEILNGKNRRMSQQAHLFSGGLIRCAHCGFAMTGERIRRFTGGKNREYVYYRCANNRAGDEHPHIRWREDHIEETIIKELASFKMPPHIADWFRVSIKAAFSDVEALQRQLKQTLSKRKSELEGMLDRLLNGFLAGNVDEKVFNAKSDEMKREAAEVEESLAKALKFDPEAPVRALALFDFSQNLVDLWKVSNSEQKREIIEAISLKRTLSDASLELAKRYPFGHLAEHANIENGRGERI